MKISQDEFDMLRRLFPNKIKSAHLPSNEYEEISMIPHFQELFHRGSRDGEHFCLQLTDAAFNSLNSPENNRDMDNTIRIGTVNSPKYDGIRYQVGFNESNGTVYIETKRLEIVYWHQVGENVDVTSPDRISDAMNVATEFLKTNEDILIFKRVETNNG